MVEPRRPAFPPPINVLHMFKLKPESTKNIDPRIGLAWDIFGDGKTAFRAAYGIYHDLIYPHFYVVGSGFIYPNGTTQLGPRSAARRHVSDRAPGIDHSPISNEAELQHVLHSLYSGVECDS